MERFWNKVDKSGDCWKWTAGLFSNGYGAFKLDGKLRKAHRVSYEMHHGPIPEGLLVLHKCDNPKCVNPDHLFLGTHKTNAEDRQNKGRGTCGIHGNQVKGENHYGAKLTVPQVKKIRSLEGKMTMEKIANIYGVSRHNVWAIIRRRKWKSII